MQKEHKAFKHENSELKSLNQTQKEEIDKLTVICLKTRAAIEDLTRRNKLLVNEVKDLRQVKEEISQLRKGIKIEQEVNQKIQNENDEISLCNLCLKEA